MSDCVDLRTMAEEDIYGSKEKYYRFIENLDNLLTSPPPASGKGKRKYYCQNPENLRYFLTLHNHFESRDLSYSRRNRCFDIVRLVVHHAEKDLSKCSREDIDRIVSQAHQVYRSVESKRTFVAVIKRVWKVLFPELDERGRSDERLIPYVVRHLSGQVDKSKERMRNDRLTPEEYGRIVSFFSNDARMQAYITLAVESLGRPQEICYTTIRDVELHENYACVWVSSHGKEGIKFLQCVDSFPYVMRWLEQHPHRKDPGALLFLANGERDRPLTPSNINRKLRIACQKLGIEKSITAYSLKRNGVTFSRLRGDSDLEIQHKAGWTSTRQLKTYDLSTADDAFRLRLEKLGLVAAKKADSLETAPRKCLCGQLLGFSDSACRKCLRPVEKADARKAALTEQEIRKLLEAALKDPNRSFAAILQQSQIR